MTTLIIATRNAHKVREIRAFLGESLGYLTLNDFRAVPAVSEDSNSFAGNAAKKATELARWLATHPQVLAEAAESAAISEVYCLADDSGLEVDALGGAPGVHSARFAAMDSGSLDNSADEDNNAKLLQLLETIRDGDRTAQFRCCIALTPVLLDRDSSDSAVCFANEAELRTEVFEGTCEGHIARTPRGIQGFGYDPLFIPNGCEQSFAELGQEVKNQISHRSKALQKVQHWLQGRR